MLYIHNEDDKVIYVIENNLAAVIWIQIKSPLVKDVVFTAVHERHLDKVIQASFDTFLKTTTNFEDDMHALKPCAQALPPTLGEWYSGCNVHGRHMDKLSHHLDESIWLIKQYLYKGTL